MSTCNVDSLILFGNDIIHKLSNKINSNQHINSINPLRNVSFTSMCLLSTMRSHYYHLLICIIFMLYHTLSTILFTIHYIIQMCIKLIIIYMNHIVLNIHISSNKYILFILYTCIQPLSCQLNLYTHDTGPNGTDIWKSTSDFIPIQSQSFGNITLGAIMSAEFNFTWWGRTHDPRPNYTENFFRVGFDAKTSTSCNGESSSYPSFWLKNDENILYVSVSTGASCNANYWLDDYGIITKNKEYHIKISFNNSFLVVDIDPGNYQKIWSRQPTQSQYLGQQVPIWFMSNKFGGTDYNRGNGTFSNIIILSGQFTGSPTSAPTISPSISPSFPPSITPSFSPTQPPSNTPSFAPSISPSISPSFSPSNTPSFSPSNTPSLTPSNVPTIAPTHNTKNPTENPTKNPTKTPTFLPSETPSSDPSIAPTDNTEMPSQNPSKFPTKTPTFFPSTMPTIITKYPTDKPTTQPTDRPTDMPTVKGQSKSQIILREGSFEGDCEFECWECLQQIDIIGTDDEWLLAFMSVNETNCDCPTQNAEENRGQVDIGSGDYYLQIEKTIKNYDISENNIQYNTQYLLKVNVITWDRQQQSCSVLYYVNQNDFFGIRSQDILTITFTICNVSDELLTEDKLREAEEVFNNNFAELFDINITQVNSSINVGTYCSNASESTTTTTTKSGGLVHRNGNDEQVTVVIIFTNAKDATSAGENACDEIKEEMNIVIENCEVEISSEDKIPIPNDEDNDDFNIFGLSLVEFIIFIFGIVFGLILMACIIYCYLSHRKRTKKKELDSKYNRKRTMSGGGTDTIRGSVVTRGGEIGHTPNQNSDQINGNVHAKSDSKPTLHIANVSVKMDGNMEPLQITPGGPQTEMVEKNATKSDKIHGDKKRLKKPKLYQNISSITNTNSLHSSVKAMPLHYSNESQEMQDINIGIKPIPSQISTMRSSDGGSPYTLVPSYDDNRSIFNFSNKNYKTGHDMIEDVVEKKLANEIKNDDIDIEKQIGNGQFGAVFKATWEGNVVVIKQLNSINEEEQIQQEESSNGDNIEGNIDNLLEDYAGEYDNADGNNSESKSDKFEKPNENYDEDDIKKEESENINMNDEDTQREKKKEARLKEMKGEILLASSLPTHNNLVEIFGYTEAPFGVVMSYMSGGSVERFVYRKYKKETDAIPSIIELLIILSKVASGIKHLHNHELIHRDIACRNILLGKINNNRIDLNTEVRISDFGLTRQLEHINTNNVHTEQKTKSNFGPLKWMSPESIKDKIYSKKSDVYMFGITMWEIFYGMEPYINMLPIAVAMIVVNKGVRPPILHDRKQYRYTDMPHKYKMLMEECWEQRPNKRPSFEQIITILDEIRNHPII